MRSGGDVRIGRFSSSGNLGPAGLLGLKSSLYAKYSNGNESDFVVWQQPRLVAPERPDLLLRDVRSVASQLTARRAQLFASAAAYLNAANEVSTSEKVLDVAAYASQHSLNETDLRAWLDYLGFGAGAWIMEAAAPLTVIEGNTPAVRMRTGLAAPSHQASGRDTKVRVSSRRRVLFVAENVTLAQCVRLVTLARALDPQAYEVHFASSEFEPVRHR